MTQRRLPRPAELRQVLRPRPQRLDPVERRLARAHSVDDLRVIARRRTPRAVFDYTDGGTEEERSLARNREAFGRVEFSPRVLRDVSKADPSTVILGRPAALPLAFAPTGFTRMMQHEGEPAVARVAHAAGVPYCLSTLGTTSVEELVAAAPGGRNWFQLYLFQDRAASRDLIARAEAAGYEAIVLTVDVPIQGGRRRDLRSGLTMPPTLTLRTLAEGTLHPSWWFNFLTTEPLRFASFGGHSESLADQITRVFDPSLTFDDVTWLRSVWPGTLVVKGIQSVDDARALADLGVDGLVVSNHGARQLDRAPVPLELLGEVTAAVGDRVEVLLDGGVRTGADVVAAVALGARAVLVGRAYLYGLMAGGQQGVQRVLDLLATEIVRTMILLGVTAIDQLDPTYARLRER
ncbi:MAG: alpha-hydroxy acid oxidase [Acidimicrobiia bacterium]